MWQNFVNVPQCLTKFIQQWTLLKKNVYTPGHIVFRVVPFCNFTSLHFMMDIVPFPAGGVSNQLVFHQEYVEWLSQTRVPTLACYKGYTLISVLQKSWTKHFALSFILLARPYSSSSKKQLFCASQYSTKLSSNGNGKKPKKAVDIEELKSLLNNGQVQLFDVREPKELQQTGVIPNAINIPCKLKTNTILC